MDRTILLPLLLALVAGCASAPKFDVAAALGEEFSLSEGQAAYLQSERMLVKFDGITEDSRCPSDVVCVWAGQVTASLKVAGDGYTLERNVTLGADADASVVFSDTKGKSYVLDLLQVAPYPKSTDASRDYSVKLRIRENQ